MRYGIPVLSEKDIEDIRKDPDNQNWNYLSEYNLSEEFMREFQDKIYWFAVCYYHSLSEEFILEFQDKLGWLNISRYQALTKEFIAHNFNRLTVSFMLKNITLSDKIKEFCRMFL